MRYIWLLGVVVLVSCPQNQPRLQPVAPTVGQPPPVTQPKIISEPPAFNPGNISLELRSDKQITADLPEENGMKQKQLTLDASVVHFFAVAAGSQDVSASDIVISLQPVPKDQLWVEDTRDALNMREKHYRFMQEHVPGVTIPPVILIALARKKSYCEKVFNHNTTNGNVDKLAEGGIKPDIPSSARHCGSFNEIYNFDQKMRIHLVINNVPNVEQMRKDARYHAIKERAYCTALNRAKDKIVGKLQDDFSWGGKENSWRDIIGDIVVGTIADVVQYRIENEGFNCTNPEYQPKEKKQQQQQTPPQ